MALGFGSLIAAFLLAGAATAGIGFLLGLVIAALMTIVSWLTPDALQDWLGQSLTFGKYQRYDGPVAQALALQKLVQGE